VVLEIPDTISPDVDKEKKTARKGSTLDLKKARAPRAGDERGAENDKGFWDKEKGGGVPQAPGRATYAFSTKEERKSRLWLGAEKLHAP